MAINQEEIPRQKERTHYFDSARALASIMGVFFHASLIFTQKWKINIAEEQFSDSFNSFIFYLNIFRMPLFLFIAGYFSYSAFGKYGSNKFIKQRVKRILLPFLSSLIFLLPLQYYFSLKFKYGAEWSEYILPLLNPLDKQFKFAHLWFLYEIFLFSFLLIGFLWLKKRIKWIQKATNKIKWLNKHILTTILFWTILNIFLIKAGKSLDEMYSISSSWLPLRNIGVNLPIFLFGSFVSSMRHSMFLLNGRLETIVVLFVGYSTMVVFNNYFYGAANLLGVTALKWLMFLGILNLLKYALDYNHKVLKYCSNASYSFYLFHQPVVIIIAYFYLDALFFSSHILNYLFICSVSIVLTYLFYELIVKRSRIGSFLFTGADLKRLKK